MIPATILHQLSRSRRREYFLRFTWGAARLVALVLVLLAIACLADWTLDRLAETPWPVRVLMLLVQVSAGAAAVLFFLVLPLWRRTSNSALALLVEDKVPELGQRLISAVELNRKGAKTGGMSPELIGIVTREAETHASRLNFARVLDLRRLKWSAALVLPVVVILALPVWAWTDTVSILLARQLLSSDEIPRGVYVTSVSDKVAPSGEEVVLRFVAKGPAVSDDLSGFVVLFPEGEQAQHYPLNFDPSTYAGLGEASYTARIPAAATDFGYRAYLGDGRTAQLDHLKYVARPIVVEQRGWMVMPPYVEPRPDGKPYEQEQPQGEVIALADASVRVAVTFQKPVIKAEVEILGIPEAAEDATASQATESVVDTIRLRLSPDGKVAERTFELKPKNKTKAYGRLTGYRTLAWDHHNFRNSAPPRRGIRIIAEEAPLVTLLPEVFLPEGLVSTSGGPSDDFTIEGMPIPPDGRIRIVYSCAGPYGLGGARLRYRVLRKEEKKDGESTVDLQTPWLTLPLIEKAGSKEVGKFDPRRGAFEKSPDDEQVQFHGISSLDPELFLPRTQGGGRFDFETKGLKVKPGDQVEYYVEVFPVAIKKPGDLGREPDESRPFGRSDNRMKGVVTEPDFRLWLSSVIQEEGRIRQLTKRQGGVFGAP